MLGRIPTGVEATNMNYLSDQSTLPASVRHVASKWQEAQQLFLDNAVMSGFAGINIKSGSVNELNVLLTELHLHQAPKKPTVAAATPFLPSAWHNLYNCSACAPYQQQ